MDDEPESRLLALPPELRNRIYEFVFAGGHAEVGHRSTKPHHAKYQPTSSGIIMACKQTNEEASDHFYFLTTFDFTSRFAAVSFLTTLPRRYAKLIVNIRYDAIAEYHASVGIDVYAPLSWMVESTQGWQFELVHRLEMARCPGPKTIEVSVKDWILSDAPKIWTTTPWQTFLEIYGGIPDNEKHWHWYDQFLVEKNQTFFERTHEDIYSCWDQWVSKFIDRTCLCVAKDEES
ncbi:hypothetical protein PRZ48_014177 [Zasmidium cellare]|uniref:Uncharacterized protein n=1 Tax=Zasmidium cellare TaxID=395010 RepID=A0ABR0E070_ZASCE|nr:hypothetical protein PRZ48_014177 [Zasmidium cellare]